jgi:hypothetical protein
MRLVLLVSSVALLSAQPLLAADRASPPQDGWQRPTPAQMAAHRAEREAKQSADIALLLGLRADQKPALDSFLSTMHPHGMHHGPDGGAKGGHGPDGTPPPPENTMAMLDHMDQRIDQRDADAKQRIAATKRFYTALTPEQQQRFDAMAHLMHGHFGHEGGHGGPGGGRHGMHADD